MNLVVLLHELVLEQVLELFLNVLELFHRGLVQLVHASYYQRETILEFYFLQLTFSTDVFN